MGISGTATGDMAVVERTQRTLARRVLTTMMVLLLGSAVSGVELWPLSSYRLFSVVRSDAHAARELVAVHGDGSRTPVRFGADNPVVATTAHLLDDVRHQSPQRQRRMAEAWLAVSDTNLQDVVGMRVEIVWRVQDPDSLRWTEESRSVDVDVTL